MNETISGISTFLQKHNIETNIKFDQLTQNVLKVCLLIYNFHLTANLGLIIISHWSQITQYLQVENMAGTLTSMQRQTLETTLKVFTVKYLTIFLCYLNFRMFQLNETIQKQNVETNLKIDQLTKKIEKVLMCNFQYAI